MRRLDFYFDLISPYAYLAWTQLPAIVEQFDLTLHAEPVLFAALLNHHGQKGPAEIPAKRVFTIRDMLRWAQLYDVPLEGPPAHPFSPLLPLRTILAVEDQKQRNAFSGALLVATWGEGRDLTQPAVIKEVAEQVGLSGRELLEKAETPAIKEALKANTQRAIDQGVFGVPTFIADSELFWGNDRLPLLKEFLAGGAGLDQAKVDRVLARPQAAVRKPTAS